MSFWKPNCSKNDVECWKREFKAKIKCEEGDTECWKHIIYEFPCRFTDIECWKENLPNIPCEFTDFACWKDMIPSLPCKTTDISCWSAFTSEKIKDATKGINEKIEEGRQYVDRKKTQAK